MNKYIFPALLIIVLAVIAYLFYPNPEEKKIRAIITDCEASINNKDIEPAFKYLDKGFTVPEYNLNYEDVISSKFILKYIAMIGNVDVRKIDITIEDDFARAYMIARVTNSNISYEMPFEINAEFKKTNETWTIKIMHIKPYELQRQ